MNKNFWKYVYFTKNYVPKLTCPTCDRGLLTILDKNFIYYETAESREHNSQEYSQYEWTQFRFSVILECNNSLCKDIVSASGTGGLEHDYEEDQESGEYYNSYSHFFIPKYFEPPIKILPTRPEYSKKINTLLTDSFSLYFSDNASCANKIRQIVERILDEKGIKKTTINKKRKRVDIPLSQRIEIFKNTISQYADIGDQFAAIKWIGNIGSHSSNIERTQILDAYEMLHYCLDELFINRKKQKSIKQLSKSIIKRKGK